MQFTERTALETGFAIVFEDTVKPRLTGIEAERIEQLGNARKFSLMAAGVGVVLAALVAVIFRSDVSYFFSFAIIVMGIVAAFAIRKAIARSWSGSVAAAVMPAICNHVGDMSYDSSASAGFPTSAMTQLGMLPHYDSASFSDRLEGRYRDTGFLLVEASLSKQTRNSDGKTKSQNVFRGLLFEIDVPVASPTPFLITRDYGALGNSLGAMFSGSSGRGMPKVELDNTAFEAVFEAHAEDPAAARTFLPSIFLVNLLAFGEGVGGKIGAKGMKAGFVDRSLYLALERGGDFLKMGSLTTPVMEMEEDLHEIFEDLELIRRIIDRLHGAT